MMMMMIIMGIMIMVRAAVGWAKDGTKPLITRRSSSCNRERTKRRR